VRVTAYDAWRIKRAQALEFEQFLYTQPDPQAMPGSFLLGEERHALYLGKNPRNKDVCTFLMHFPDGTMRCGVYAERPRVCSVYPMTFKNGSVDIRADVQCKAENWNLATITYPLWRRNLLEHFLEGFINDRVASRWNESPRHATATLADYYRYADAAFGEIDAARTSRGESFEDLILHWQDSSKAETLDDDYHGFFSEVDAICERAGTAA
jgi:Fe-S-cluster containining protein